MLGGGIEEMVNGFITTVWSDMMHFPFSSIICDDSVIQDAIDC